MRVPSVKVNSEKFLVLGAYHIAMLGTDEQYAEMMQYFVDIQEDLRKSKLYLQSCEEETMEASAKKNLYDDILDREVIAFEKRLFEFVEKDKKNSVYKGLFPGGVASVTRVPLNKMMELVHILESVIEKSDLPDDLISFSESLRLIRQTLHGSANAYRAALKKESEARLELILNKEAWIRMYSINYGELIKRFPKDRNRAKAFFKKQYRKTIITEIDSEEE
jgi:hypothetical protein